MVQLIKLARVFNAVEDAVKFPGWPRGMLPRPRSWNLKAPATCSASRNGI